MKIVIWTGAAWEPWGPDSIESGGIGGSETAAIRVSHALAKLGHEVVMFGTHEGHEGVQDYDGARVTYNDYRASLREPKQLDCDVLISSRDKRILRLGSQARRKVLWVHDIHVGDDHENEVSKFDEVLCLSRWHKDLMRGYYPHVPAEKLLVTRNGIDPKLYSAPLPEKRPVFVYSSSPDRGLDKLLDFWPKIRRIRDDAELHVYYGFDNWEKMSANSRVGMLRINFLKSRMEALAKEGVVYHGRVGQSILAEAQRTSLLWAYPTDFKETYCISALENQAAGAVPITTKLAALAETVRWGCLVDPFNTEARYEAEFVAAIERYLPGGLLGDEATSFRPKMREQALALSWESLAAEWSARWESSLR